MKLLQFKVYNTAGTYIKNWADASLISFSKRMNGGIGECVIDLARTINNWKDSADIDLNYRVQIYISDKDNGYLKIYDGFISNITFNGDGVKEKTTVKCLGFIEKLAVDFYKNDTLTTIAETAADPSTMLKNIIYRLSLENTELSFLGCTPSSIELTGLSFDYSFQAVTYLEAIEACLKLAPSNWYWFLDANNVFNFKSKSISPVHFFSLGGNISSYEIVNDMENVRNGVLIWNGAAVYRYLKDANSITDYGRRIEKIINSSVGTDTDTMDGIANAFIGEKRDPTIRLRLTIIDNNENSNGYDIDSVQPGETCRVSGIPVGNDFLDKNMIIRSVDYYIDKIVIEVEDWKQDKMEDILTKIDRSLVDKKTDGIATTYTAV